MEIVFLAVLILLMGAALGSGYPVAFALPGSAIVAILLAAGAGWLAAGDAAAYFVHGGPYQWLSAGITNLRGVYWEAERDTLIAIPLFVFMGIMLQRSKIAEDLLLTMAQLFGPVPGGLGISVVFVGALLAATTGIVGATVVAMGLISLPAMLQRGYSRPLATGTIAASGTLGQIIPPSIVLIILADQLAAATDQAAAARNEMYRAATGEPTMPSEFDVVSTSAGEMFLGAVIPGMVLVVLYMVFILALALIRPQLAPAVSYDGRYDAGFLLRVLLTLVPPLALIVLVLGSIIFGIATVNQAGAIGAAGALVMAGYRLNEGQRRQYWPAILSLAACAAIGLLIVFFDVNINSVVTPRDRLGLVLSLAAVAALLAGLAWSGWRAYRTGDTLRGVMVETAKTTSLVFIILMGAAMLTAAFRAFGGEDLVRHGLEGLPGGFWTKFTIVMAVIFVLGFFLDFIEITVVVVPIVAPILLADPQANVSAVWLGVMIALNIQTSFLTPPFGFALFYLRGVAPAIVRTMEIYRGVVVFIGLQLAALAVVGFYPGLVNYLPNRMALLAETAPPPRNPRLQYCLDAFAAERFAASDGAIAARVDALRGQDAGYLPDELSAALVEGLDGVETAMVLLADALAAEAAVAAAEPAYRPRHREVREIETGIRALDARIAERRTAAQRLRDADAAERRAEIETLIEELAAERVALEASVPEGWTQVNEEFRALQQVEAAARLQFRRASDDAYANLAEVLAALDDSAAFVGLGGELTSLAAEVEAGAAQEELAAALEELAERFGAIEGVGEVTDRLEEAQEAPGASAAIRAAADAYAAELAWRERAEALRPRLAALEAQIRDTLGARAQDRLSRDQALFIAACNAGHRDVSLSF